MCNKLKYFGGETFPSLSPLVSLARVFLDLIPCRGVVIKERVLSSDQSEALSVIVYSRRIFPIPFAITCIYVHAIVYI